MKIRMGFVSNSSSSSFIIAIPKNEDITTTTVAKNVFPKTVSIERLGFGFYESGVSASHAVDIITQDLKNSTPNDETRIKEALDGYVDRNSMDEALAASVGNPPKYPEHVWTINDRAVQDRIFMEYSTAHDEWVERVIVAFKSANPDCDIYTLEYSDNDGSVNSAMEHGGVFNQMITAGRALAISHH